MNSTLPVSNVAPMKHKMLTSTDNLYLHWRDFDTSVEEVMNGLHILVQQGKVLYLVMHIKSPCLDCDQGKSIRS